MNPHSLFRSASASILIALTVLTIGCHQAQNDPTRASATQPAKSYPLRGKIVSTNPGKGEVTIDHQAIPGFMEAMTMPYKLADVRIIGELHPGDTITADIMVPQGGDADVTVDHIVVVGQAKPDYRPTTQFHVPQPGEKVPDFHLTNEEGKPIHFAQFRGKALLVTFIYTRCPLPDFCPRVTRNFAAVEKSLVANPTLSSNTHLLCASFDPDGDTPARLKAYGATYIGPDAPKTFSHWDFAVPSKSALPELAQYFNVGLNNEPNGTITHTLSTTLIGPDGKVVRFYAGNDWTPEQLLADIEKLYPSQAANGTRGAL